MKKYAFSADVELMAFSVYDLEVRTLVFLEQMVKLNDFVLKGTLGPFVYINENERWRLCNQEEADQSFPSEKEIRYRLWVYFVVCAEDYGSAFSYFFDIMGASEFLSWDFPMQAFRVENDEWFDVSRSEVVDALGKKIDMGVKMGVAVVTPFGLVSGGDA